jgi:hypothetical protein
MTSDHGYCNRGIAIDKKTAESSWVFLSQTFAKQHKRAARRAGFCFVAEAVNDALDIE